MANAEKEPGSDWEGFVRDAGERDRLDRAIRVNLSKKPLTFWQHFSWALLTLIPIFFVLGVVSGWVRGEILGAWTHHRYTAIWNSVVVAVSVYLPCATVLAFITAVVGVLRSNKKLETQDANFQSVTPPIPTPSIPIATPVAQSAGSSAAELAKPTETIQAPSVPLASPTQPAISIPAGQFGDSSTSMAAELAKLTELYRVGGLTENEFAKAKAAVISGNTASREQLTLAPLGPSRGWTVPWKLILTIGFFAAAYFTNPDQASLEKVCRETMEKNKAKAGMLENLAANAFLDVSFERKNYYLFSVGTIRSRVHLVRTQVDIEVLGAFGRWWFELLETPLYQKK